MRVAGRPISVDSDALAAFCRRWGVAELSLFGSVLRSDFRQDSDVDVLVTFESGSQHTLLDWVRMEEELERLFGRRVDLVDREAIERSHNYILRRHVLERVEPLYVA